MPIGIILIIVNVQKLNKLFVHLVTLLIGSSWNGLPSLQIEYSIALSPPMILELFKFEFDVLYFY